MLFSMLSVQKLKESIGKKTIYEKNDIKKIFCVMLKHVLSKRYYFECFCETNFHENVENRLFLGEKFDF